MQYISAGDKSPYLLRVGNGIAVDNNPYYKQKGLCMSFTKLPCLTGIDATNLQKTDSVTLLQKYIPNKYPITDRR